MENIKLSDIAKNRKTLISLRVILAIIGLGGVFLAYFNPWMLILTPKVYKKALDIGIIQEDFTQLSDNLISSVISTIGNTETLDTIIAKNLNLYYPIHTREDQAKEILGDDSIWSDISSAFGDGGGFSSDSSSGGGSDGGGAF